MSAVVGGRALIGHTGLIGSNLRAQRPWDACANSRSDAAVRGGAFDHVVCAAMYAEKWRINQDPAPDRANLLRLQALLGTITAQRFVLISTVDVYPDPVEVDESAPIELDALQPYGRHRLELEHFVRTQWPETLIVRLPAVVGPGLKKNALYDLAHDHRVEFIHPDHAFQFFPLTRLADAIDAAMAAGLRLVNFATAPVRMGDVAQQVFDRALVPPPDATPVRYDFRTLHAGAFGCAGPYMLGVDDVMAGIRAYAESVVR